MTPFHLKDGELHAENVPLSAIAREFGTPCYVYSKAALVSAFDAFERALTGSPHLICYAMKANSNLAILDLFARRGSGFDIVSAGELKRVIAAGGDPGKVVFSGVGKSEADIRFALSQQILCFNVESRSELLRISKLASEMDCTAPISIRVNPDVDAGTHPYISTGLKENKFGIAIADAPAVYARAASRANLRVTGVDCHIGSQLTTLAPFTDTLDRLLLLVERLAADGIGIDHIDLGGGIGIRYRDEQPPHPSQHIAAVLERLAGLPYAVYVEPGRAIVGNAGLLLTRVEFLKCSEHKNFAIVDAAMNDLIRPSLYSAWMEIIPADATLERAQQRYDVVGPICETGDFLGKDRELAVAEGDLLAVRSAGAYGFTMSSNYNARPRAAEVLVDGSEVHLVRARESLASLYAGESVLPA